jgi:hypothetical protein
MGARFKMRMMGTEREKKKKKGKGEDCHHNCVKDTLRELGAKERG